MRPGWGLKQGPTRPLGARGYLLVSSISEVLRGLGFLWERRTAWGARCRQRRCADLFIRDDLEHGGGHHAVERLPGSESRCTRWVTTPARHRPGDDREAGLIGRPFEGLDRFPAGISKNQVPGDCPGKGSRDQQTNRREPAASIPGMRAALDDRRESARNQPWGGTGILSKTIQGAFHTKGIF